MASTHSSLTNIL